MPEIKTYDEMNKKLVGILRVSDELSPLYAAQRIEELEKENAELKNALRRIASFGNKYGGSDEANIAQEALNAR